MFLRDRFDGRDSPFEGDLPLTLRGLRDDARVLKATARVVPIDNSNGMDAFVEEIRFDGVQGVRVATLSESTSGTLSRIEVDFHGRRTLVGVQGSLVSAELQANLGGAYVAINDKGAIAIPGNTLLSLNVLNGTATLPALTVARFQLTQARPPLPDLNAVLIRSAPSNVSLSLRGQAPFFVRTGEMTVPEDVPDFAQVLRPFLDEAESEGGFFSIPLLVHSDSIARLEVSVEIEFVVERSLLDDRLERASLSFGASTRPDSKPELTVQVPVDARIVPGLTRVRLQGAFQEGEIAKGPTGADDPAASVAIRPGVTVGQEFTLEGRTQVEAVDVLVGPSEQRARLQLDLRGDRDGNPGQDSRLSAPVEFEVERRVDGRPFWNTVSLARPVQLDADRPASGGPAKIRYWLVLQSLEGEAVWPARKAGEGANGFRKTRNGELSWQSVEVRRTDDPLEALFRLRRLPTAPRVPLELVVGSGPEAQRVSLQRFQALGAVDFTVDSPELADGYNRFIDQQDPAACPSGEHLRNGDFEDWVVLGDALGHPISIPLESVDPNGTSIPTSPTALALSPDGNWAYVAGFAASRASLHVIDLTADRLVQSTEVGETEITSLAVGHDGSRIYAAAGSQIGVFDVVAGEKDFSSLGRKSVHLLAVSRSQLFASGSFPQTGVAFLDLIEVERGGSLAAKDLKVSLGPPSPAPPIALSPDGRRLFVAAQVDGTDTVLLVDAVSGRVIDSVPIGTLTRGIAPTPDGRGAWVAHAKEPSVSFVDLTTKSVSKIVSVAGPPTTIAISGDGQRIFSTSQVKKGRSSKGMLTVIDASRQQVVKTMPVGRSAQHVAVTTQADRILVTDPDGHAVHIIPSGIRQPAEWTITSGRVRMTSLAGVAGRGVKLGSISEAGEACATTALSQVVPVAPSCPFDFSFDGIAFNSDAVAEVRWIGADCELIRTDLCPIQVVEPPVTPASGDFPAQTEPIALLPHRRRLTSPGEALFAEVRFLAPAGDEVRIGRVSLDATADLVENGDFQVVKANRPDGWTLQPAMASGFSILPADTGSELANEAFEPIELRQTVPVQAESEFTLEARGRVRAGEASNTAQVTVSWLDSAGQPLDAPGEQLTLGRDFEVVARRGKPPKGAASAEVSLILPPRSTVDVEGVSLTFQETIGVPLNFISQSPGELTVSQPTVVFETRPVPPPAVPESGLCTPTPPELEPGQPCGKCFCACCETDVKPLGTRSARTPLGCPAQVATCPECGSPVVTIGGIPGPAETVPQRLLPPPSLRRPFFEKAARLAPATVEAGSLPALTEIPQIGKVRAGLLRASGIENIVQLADSSPARVADALRGVTAESFIRQASALLARHRASSAPPEGLPGSRKDQPA